MATRIKKKNNFKAWGRRLVLFIAVLFIFSNLQVFLLRYINPPFSACMVLDWVGSGRGFDLTLDWAGFEELSPNLAGAVLAAEDQRFFEHHGFDWREVKKAVKDGREGKKLRGASTITMQTAKNMFLWPSRSWLRKGLEAYYTILLESFLSKERILELYLNIAEFGIGVYGATAAIRHFYHQSPDQLTPEQAVRLAVVLPNPKDRSPMHISPAMKKKVRRILNQMQSIRGL